MGVVSGKPNRIQTPAIYGKAISFHRGSCLIRKQVKLVHIGSSGSTARTISCSRQTEVLNP